MQFFQIDIGVFNRLRISRRSDNGQNNDQPDKQFQFGNPGLRHFFRGRFLFRPGILGFDHFSILLLIILGNFSFIVYYYAYNVLRICKNCNRF